MGACLHQAEQGRSGYVANKFFCEHRETVFTFQLCQYDLALSVSIYVQTVYHNVAFFVGNIKVQRL